MSFMQIIVQTGDINAGNQWGIEELLVEVVTGLWGTEVLYVCLKLNIYFLHHFSDNSLINQAM